MKIVYISTYLQETLLFNYDYWLRTDTMEKKSYAKKWLFSKKNKSISNI